MGLIGRVLRFARSVVNGARVDDVVYDPGGGENRTGQVFAPPGVDGQPLPEDFAYGACTPQTGRTAVLGYVDPENANEAAPGELRLYSRDANGAPVATVWLRADGSVTVQNASGSFALAASGEIDANGVTISPNGDLSVPGSIVATGNIQGAGVTDTTSNVTLSTHTHASDGAPPNPGS